MTERLKSYLLVILKHEKPVKDLSDVVADRLSKMEGVDGSGVIVGQVTQFAAHHLIRAVEAEDAERFGGKPVESSDETTWSALVESFRNTEYRDVRKELMTRAVEHHAKQAGIITEEEARALYAMVSGRMEPLPDPPNQLIVSTPGNQSGMTDDAIGKTARAFADAIVDAIGKNIKL